MTPIKRFVLAVSLFFLTFTAFASSVDVNSADAGTLAASLKGVGQAKAEAIVAFRAAHGPFRTADDLIQVKGIGEKIVDQNRADIVLGSDPAKP
jgi:competence protein ComEA